MDEGRVIGGWKYLLEYELDRERRTEQYIFLDLEEPNPFNFLSAAEDYLIRIYEVFIDLWLLFIHFQSRI